MPLTPGSAKVGVALETEQNIRYYFPFAYNYEAGTTPSGLPPYKYIYIDKNVMNILIAVAITSSSKAFWPTVF